MNQDFQGWCVVAEKLVEIAKDKDRQLKDGQRRSLCAVADRLQSNGVIIADEVGMGKTRIAATVANSVIAAGGRVAILVPPGLGFQWGEELRTVDVEAPAILRSLWQYLQAWDVIGDGESAKRAACPWFDQQCVLISHAFTNWRLGEKSEPWRWALLPELYAQWRKQTDGRWPRNYRDNGKLDDDWVKNAAQSIAEAISKYPEDHAVRELLKTLAEATPWPGALAAAEYARNGALRLCLERAVGLGLGVFDLVIVDEAHKSRGQDSGLNRLLEYVVLQSECARRLAITATPVELEAEQWNQALDRIKADAAMAPAAITCYSDAVRKVRQCPSDKAARENYLAAAQGFKEALRPFLLRRDKREDEFVRKFQTISGEGFHAYRREKEILIDTTSLSPAWKQTVCAAEALSVVTRQSADPVAKRLRLTLGNGHGLAALIDQMYRHQQDDQKQDETDADSSVDADGDCAPEESSDKRWLRSNWWQQVMMQSWSAGGSGDSALYDHPAILASVCAIEATCQQDEKVLVFGRFTRPLRALVDLLNAREMLRCLDDGRNWPQSSLLPTEVCAIHAAHRQLGRPGQLAKDDLKMALEQQYKQLEQRRQRNREHLLKSLDKVMAESFKDARARVLFDMFRKEVAACSDRANNEANSSLAVVARAVHELMEKDAESISPADYANAFTEIVSAATDGDEGDADGDGKLDDEEASALWGDVVARLGEEYNRPEGGFARLMHGETRPATRRLLQLAFNRRHSHPKVLVAQSVVGREGLNLHKACRTVVLLHPEWNPGVVEQQIGRVDRIGSLWETKLAEAEGKRLQPEGLPRIEIRPVVFKGTYDEKNWQVLRDRWDELRAQLHGIVISSCVAARFPEQSALIKEINDSAPNFSPSAVDVPLANTATSES